MAELVQLEVLDLTANRVASLAPLAGLKNLTALIAAEARIADLPPLAELDRLTTLNVQGNRIRSANPLLASQVCRTPPGGNQVSDIGALAKRTHLEILDLSANPIEDFAPLLDLPPLRFLNVKGILLDPETPETLEKLGGGGGRVFR